MTNCKLCGQPMPPGEEMFQFHGYSGPCPQKPEPCDHEWELVDDSFGHEYGTEQIMFQRCKLCDAERDYEPPTFEDDVL